jgi:hypothetical protein
VVHTSPTLLTAAVGNKSIELRLLSVEPDLRIIPAQRRPVMIDDDGDVLITLTVQGRSGKSAPAVLEASGSALSGVVSMELQVYPKPTSLHRRPLPVSRGGPVKALTKTQYYKRTAASLDSAPDSPAAKRPAHRSSRDREDDDDDNDDDVDDDDDDNADSAEHTYRMDSQGVHSAGGRTAAPPPESADAAAEDPADLPPAACGMGEQVLDDAAPADDPDSAEKTLTIDASETAAASLQ